LQVIIVDTLLAALPFHSSFEFDMEGFDSLVSPLVEPIAVDAFL
jgi:hypothetical protein